MASLLRRALFPAASPRSGLKQESLAEAELWRRNLRAERHRRGPPPGGTGGPEPTQTEESPSEQMQVVGLRLSLGPGARNHLHDCVGPSRAGQGARSERQVRSGAAGRSVRHARLSRIRWGLRARGALRHCLSHGARGENGATRGAWRTCAQTKRFSCCPCRVLTLQGIQEGLGSPTRGDGPGSDRWVQGELVKPVRDLQASSGPRLWGGKASRTVLCQRDAAQGVRGGGGGTHGTRGGHRKNL